LVSSNFIVTLETHSLFRFRYMRIFNVILIFNYYCRSLSDNPFICDCDMVPRQTYLSDMTLLYTGATCHTKNDQSLHSLKEFEYCIEEMKHTSDRGIFYILIIQYVLFILGTGESCQGSNPQNCSTRPQVSYGTRTLVGRGHIA
jgi:hypothetical protein